MVKFSLDTKNKAGAKRRRTIEDQRTDKWFANLAAGTALERFPITVDHSRMS